MGNGRGAMGEGRETRGEGREARGEGYSPLFRMCRSSGVGFSFLQVVAFGHAAGVI